MEHIDIPAGEIHAPHNWEYANATARGAAVITDASLINKWALQLDDGTYWRLTAVSPAAWQAAAGMGPAGPAGQDGTPGTPGSNGLSAYQIAVAGGYVGTEAQWLLSLKGTNGTNGLSAYQIAVAGGYVGTEAQWLAALRRFSRPKVFRVFADSLGDGGAPGRAAGIYDGRPFYGTTTVATPANFGGLTWLYDAKVDGRAGATGNGIGTLETDATARMRWTYMGDTPGPWVDVSTGGFFLLPTGTLANNGIFVRIRGNTAGVPNASSLVNTAGIPAISDYNTLGYVHWVAGQLGSMFSDYQTFAIPGATSADVLKFTPQGLVTPLSAALLVVGTNDLPDTIAKAQTSAANIIAIIDLLRAKADLVVVAEAPPNINATPTINRFMGIVGDIVSEYCVSLKSNVEYVSSWDRMITTTGTSTIGSGAGGRAGAYFDDIHFMPFGAKEFAVPIVNLFRSMFPRPALRRQSLRTWDSTAKVGSFNLNPTFRGTAGTFGGATPTAAGNGVTGTVPDGWTLTRVGTTQTCTTAFEASPDGGLSRFTMDVAGAAANDYHELSQQFNVPANMTVGEFFRMTTETQNIAAGSLGLAIWQAQCVSGGNIQASYVFQTGRDVANFTVEGPVLEHRGEPQKMLSGFTLFTIRIRVGARTGGGTAKVGLTFCSMDRVPGPIYP